MIHIKQWMQADGGLLSTVTAMQCVSGKACQVCKQLSGSAAAQDLSGLNQQQHLWSQVQCEGAANKHCQLWQQLTVTALQLFAVRLHDQVQHRCSCLPLPTPLQPGCYDAPQQFGVRA